MWRVILSITAAVFDGLMLLFMGLAVIGILTGPAIRPARHIVPSASVDGSAHIITLVFVGFLVTGLGLNLFAIGFGARLPIRKRASVASVASEFA